MTRLHIKIHIEVNLRDQNPGCCFKIIPRARYPVIKIRKRCFVRDGKNALRRTAVVDYYCGFLYKFFFFLFNKLARNCKSP